MLLTDVLYNTLEGYERVGINCVGIVLGYRQYYYLSEILRVAALQKETDEEAAEAFQDLVTSPINYLGYPIYPTNKDDTIEYLFATGDDAIRAASYIKAVENKVIEESPNVIRLEKPKTSGQS